LKNINNSFKENPRLKDNPEKIELDNDFFYLVGASEKANLEIKPEDGRYRFDFQSKDYDWLHDSIKTRMDKKLGENKQITPVEDGLFRYRGSNKDFVLKMSEYKNNPDKIRESSDNNQQNWLNSYLDANLTIDAKGHSEPISQVRDGNLGRLNLAMDCLEKNGIQSKIEFPKGKNPVLKIRGYDNHVKMRENLRLEKQSNLDKLDNVLSDKSRFKEFQPRNYNEFRSEIGHDFQKIMKDLIPIIRPEAEKYELKKPTNENGSKIYPDYLVKHPDGRVEAIEFKLHPGQFDKKDKDYLKHPEIDFMTVYYLEGKRDYPKKAHGKNIDHKTKDDVLSELKNARDKEKSDKEKASIDEKTHEFNRITEKAKDVSKDKDEKVEIKNSETIKVSVEEPSNPEAKDEEEGGGDGKERSQIPKDEESQEGDYIRDSSEKNKFIGKG